MNENKMLNKDVDSRALVEERETISVMIEIYCRDHHQGLPPCELCQELLEYVAERLRQCPLQEKRTTCGKCQIHCYKPSMKKQIKAVMRYAGPRMLTAHPLLAAKHLLKALAKK